MGGMGSGRWGGRPTVESALTLDINRLRRDGTLRPDATTAGSLSWRYAYSEETIASLDYRATLGPQQGHVCLRWDTTNRVTGERQEREQWVEMTSTLQPFGGRRWWWICPRTGRLVAKLHLPGGASLFASREAYRLGYRSQRQPPYDRAIARAFKLRHRLGARGGIGDPIDRPKGMRWATFDREMERVERSEVVVDSHLWGIVRKIGG